MRSKFNPRTVLSGSTLLAVLLLGLMQIAVAQDYVWAPDFPEGRTIPALEAQDQDGAIQTFDSLKGEKGLLLLLNRYFDW